MTRIAFQGENGAYSQEAIFRTFGNETETLPCRTFFDLFRAVDQGQTDFAMVPIENSTAGAINQSYDLLLDYDLKITREVVLQVRHNLMAIPGTTLADVKRVYSHPQALAQCERFIAKHDWDSVVVYDTAGAAKQISETREQNAAAIASETAARMYGLDILASDVQDIQNNFTRFFVVGHNEPARGEKSKTSLVFATRNIPGALYSCLGEFSTRGINLVKIESRPDRRRPWHYVFYLDFEGHWQDEACRDALVGLLNKSSFIKVLGSYLPADPVS